MILLQLMIWNGPGRRSTSSVGDMFAATERQEARVSRLPLPDALAALQRYERAYNSNSHLEISHRLLSVNEIDDVSDHELLARFSVFNIEDMADRLEKDGL